MRACAEAIKLAFKDNIDWILHIDTDELMYPGGAAEYSLQRVLADVPLEVDTLVFPNYESMPERDDVSSPFTEVRGRERGVPLPTGTPATMLKQAAGKSKDDESACPSEQRGEKGEGYDSWSSRVVPDR